MKMSDIFDIPLVLIDSNGLYYELDFYDYSLEQPSDFPSIAFLKKGERIYKNKMKDYRG